MSKALRLSFCERRNFTQEARAAADSAYADVGAHLGVREWGITGRRQTYIQALDIDKYTQIVELLVLETVLDYLVAKGADTAEDRASAASIINSTITQRQHRPTGTSTPGREPRPSGDRPVRERQCLTAGT